jgi:hypothetical protein
VKGDPDRAEDVEVFHYMPNDQPGYRMGRPIVFVAPILWILAIAAMVALAIGAHGQVSPIMWFVMLPLCIAALYYYTIRGAAYIVLSSDIALEEGGFRLFILGAWSVFIPLDALRDMSMYKTMYFDLHNLEELPRLGPPPQDDLFAFHVPGLTLLHKLAGFSFGLGFLPVFAVTPYHYEYERLLEKLRQAAIEQGCDPARL